MAAREPAEHGVRETGPVDRLARALALAGGGTLLALAIMVTTSVLLRWTGSDPIPGDFEIVQMAMAVVVFAFLPLCQLARANIAVDTFTTRWSESWRRRVDAAWDIVYAAVAGFLAVTLALGAADVRQSGTASMVLQFPVWPAIALAALLSIALLAAALVSALRRLRTG